MHPEAYDFLERSLNFVLGNGNVRFKDSTTVLEFGSRNINGSPRDLFTSNVAYWGVDITPGDGVDQVGDAATVQIDDLFTIVICMEVAEHTPRWREIIANAAAHLVPEGLFVFTAACEPRLPHSAWDGHNMEPQEWTNEPELAGPDLGREYYGNIDPKELKATLEANFKYHLIETKDWGDVYATATSVIL